ncbi:MAG TPA: hypothetical protein DIT95_18340 [Arenibacter sp.]|nr:hypothetical protein [Arenibacter sp.]
MELFFFLSRISLWSLQSLDPLNVIQKTLTATALLNTRIVNDFLAQTDSTENGHKTKIKSPNNDFKENPM